MENSWATPTNDGSNDFSPASSKQPLYAGFWLRAVAALVDGSILGIFTAIVISPILRLFGYDFSFDFSILEAEEDMDIALAALMQNLMFSNVINFLVGWLYYAYMESTAKQATFGKQALGIKVTDTSLERVDFSKATMRYFSKILSGITLGIGYLMVAFTEKRQGLHDIIAGTLVVKKESVTTESEYV